MSDSQGVAVELSSAEVQPQAEQQEAPAKEPQQAAEASRVVPTPRPGDPFAATPGETEHLFLSLHPEEEDEVTNNNNNNNSNGKPEQEQHDAEESDSEDDTRSDGEIEGIAWEMRQLERKFSGLSDAYQLVDRLGEGTFSSVYKAIDTRHHQYDNRLWCWTCQDAPDAQLPTPDPSSSSSRDEHNRNKGLKRKRDADADENADSLTQVHKSAAAGHRLGKPVHVAIKRIYVTSSPQRILNELDILHILKGNRSIAHLITAFRHEDQVLAVMPYEKHQDFRMYYRTMAVPQLRSYLRCLFSALAHSHDHDILHRDVKPANFLFNPATNHGTLCDFGLAEQFNPMEWQARCLHSLPCSSMAQPHGKLLSHPKSVWHQVQLQHERWTTMPDNERFTHRYTTPWLPVTEAEEEDLIERDDANAEYYINWEPVQVAGASAGASGHSANGSSKSAQSTGNASMLGKKSSRVGYLKPEQEKRPSIRANRAGTRGFRAPEVLLKCPDQTVAIDVWSVGIIILCIVTRRFPFFHSNDDVEALMEIATIFGKKKMELCAAHHNRTFSTNVPAVVDPEFSTLHQLVYSLNPRIFEENRPTPPATTEPDGTGAAQQNVEDDLTWYNHSHPLFQAVDLMRKCMALDCTRRITAKDALSHPFLKQEP